MIPPALVRQAGCEGGIKVDVQLLDAMTFRSLGSASELALNGCMAAAGRILHDHRPPAEFGHRDVGQRRIPAYGNQRTPWDAGARFDCKNPNTARQLPRSGSHTLGNVEPTKQVVRYVRRWRTSQPRPGWQALAVLTRCCQPVVVVMEVPDRDSPGSLLFRGPPTGA
jgi:hypothetical protein